MHPERRVYKSKDGPRQHIIETAERLLAEYGLEGVSLRQIGVTAGKANNSLIQYHFGDKAGLIREIISRRVESFEQRRQELFAAAEAKGQLSDLRTLLEIVLLPLAEATNADGRHVYARFLIQFTTHFQHQDGVQHPGWSRDSAATAAAQLLAKQLPFLSPNEFRNRINRLGTFFLCALVERDNALANNRPVQKEKAFFDELFAMIVAAIQVRT